MDHQKNMIVNEMLVEFFMIPLIAAVKGCGLMKKQLYVFKIQWHISRLGRYQVNILLTSSQNIYLGKKETQVQIFKF